MPLPRSNEDKDAAREVLDFISDGLKEVSTALDEASQNVRKERERLDQYPSIESLQRDFRRCDETCRTMEELKACYHRSLPPP